MVFFEILKAFDRVRHKGFLFKLEANGVKGSLLQLLSNYLSEIQQGVFLNNSLSPFQTVDAGLGRGSIFIFIIL